MFLFKRRTIWGNSFGVALTPPIINGISNIPHCDTLSDEVLADKTGLTSSAYTALAYSKHSTTKKIERFL